uniref:AAA+ ATPase domain-containing protein n=1 Tax=Anopheles culicifacies TaxID=139723 RepID=A0A182M3R9_9DIPT
MRYISFRVGFAEAIKFNVFAALLPLVTEGTRGTVAIAGTTALCTSAKITVVTSLGPEMLLGMPLSSTRLDCALCGPSTLSAIEDGLEISWCCCPSTAAECRDSPRCSCSNCMLMHPEEEAMDVDEAPEYIITSLQSNRVRSRNARGIRNLNVSLAPQTTNRQMRTKAKTCTLWLLSKLLLIAICMGISIAYINNNTTLGQHLKNNYYTAYERLTQLSHNLCSERRANFTPILAAIDANIVGQRHLHGELNNWFQAIGNSSFSCALFVGATGVGKSFTANIIAEHYPYPTNVLHLSGKDVTDERKRHTAFKLAVFKMLQDVVSNGKCTYYMIVLDYLTHNDMQFVRKISDRLRVVLFVFKGTAYNLQNDTIQATVPEARLIQFSPLSRNELECCIRREASKIGIDLSGREFIVEQVAKQINATRHGCKPVRAKLSLYSV